MDRVISSEGGRDRGAADGDIPVSVGLQEASADPFVCFRQVFLTLAIHDDVNFFFEISVIPYHAWEKAFAYEVAEFRAAGNVKKVAHIF